MNGNIVATIICFVIGIALFIFEMFTPGLGLAGLLGAIALFVAVLLQIGNPLGIMFMIALALFLVAVALLVFLYLVSRGKFDKSKLVLREHIQGTSTDLKEARVQAHTGLAGIAVTPLRPAGKAQFENEVMDVMTGGEFLPKGTKVRIEKIEGLRILVQAEVGE